MSWEFLSSFVAAIFVAIVADEILNWCPRFSEWLVYKASRRIPEQLRERLTEEWLADLHNIPGRLGKLLFSLGTCRAAYIIDHEAGTPRVPRWLSVAERVLNIGIALAILVITAPLLLIISLVIVLDSGLPIVVPVR